MHDPGFFLLSSGRSSQGTGLEAPNLPLPRNFVTRYHSRSFVHSLRGRLLDDRDREARTQCALTYPSVLHHVLAI